VVKEEAALAQLKDIHLPYPVSVWYLAPGWYLLAILLLLAVVGWLYQIHKRYKYALPKKQALELLVTYKELFAKKEDAQVVSARVSELLRRVALVYYSRDRVASLHGGAWIEFLNQTSKNLDFNSVKGMLLDSPFKTAEKIDLKPLLILSEQWIEQRSVPCSS